jgi:sec-independent protein translocase protein TatA
MAGLGWQELLIVLVIILIIFGAGKLPDIAKSLGQGVKEFREEAQAPVVPPTTSTTVVTPRPDANGVVAEAEERLDEAADRVRAEAARAEASSRDAI